MPIRKIFVVSLLLMLSAKVFAQEVKASASVEGDFPKDKIGVVTYALLQSQKSGGGVGFDFPIFQKNCFFIKDQVNANLYFSNTPLSGAKLVSLGDKLIFGSLKEINGFLFRSYGYCKFEAGFSWNPEFAAFTQAPIILETGGAGGFEFIFAGNKSFFVEFGGGCCPKAFGQVALQDFASGSFKGGYVCLTAGSKFYFK